GVRFGRHKAQDAEGRPSLHERQGDNRRESTLFCLFAPWPELGVALDILNNTGTTGPESGLGRTFPIRTIIPGDSERIEIAIVHATLGNGYQAALLISPRESDKDETIATTFRKPTADLVQQLWLVRGP